MRGDPRESPRRDDRRERDRDRDREHERERGRVRDPRGDKDRSRSKFTDERSRSPGWDKDRTPERRMSLLLVLAFSSFEITKFLKHFPFTEGDATLSLGLSSLEAAKEKEIPELPSSLAVYFREDLISHVKNLPGEAFERQVNLRHLKKNMMMSLVSNSFRQIN